MTKFQLLSAHINVGGSRDHVVVRGADDPITFPEMQVLRIVHQGEEHVHSEFVLGEVERSDADERQRLTSKYGKEAVDALYPSVAFPLPGGDPGIPTAAEVADIKKATEAARAKALAGRGGAVPPGTQAPEETSEPEPPETPEPAPAPAKKGKAPAVPDLVNG